MDEQDGAGRLGNEGQNSVLNSRNPGRISTERVLFLPLAVSRLVSSLAPDFFQVLPFMPPPQGRR